MTATAPKYMRRVLPKEEAEAFIQNMRWFAGMGRISVKKISETHVVVRATRHAWSNWVEVEKRKNETKAKG